MYNVNTIVKHTGKKNKGPVIHALKEIEKEKLIIRDRDSIYQQKEYIILTRLGQHIVALADDLKNLKLHTIVCLKRFLSFHLFFKDLIL